MTGQTAGGIAMKGVRKMNAQSDIQSKNVYTMAAGKIVVMEQREFLEFAKNEMREYLMATTKITFSIKAAHIHHVPLDQVMNFIGRYDIDDSDSETIKRIIGITALYERERREIEEKIKEVFV
jgi:hypothetical protein